MMYPRVALLTTTTFILVFNQFHVSDAFQFANQLQLLVPKTASSKGNKRCHSTLLFAIEQLPNDANGAYSNKPNEWGYSRTIVNDRERRRFERRRLRHRMRFFAPNKLFDKEYDDGEMDEDGYWGMQGTSSSSKRALVGRFIQNIVNLPKRFLGDPYLGRGRDGYGVEPGTLILVRHGESLWNANKTFTGWADPDLSPQGYREVEHAARLLLEGGYKVDVVFTSRLKRAIRSSWLLLKEMNEVYLPVFKSWRLNERMYGALTGLSKTETAVRMGAELVQEWRGSLHSRPPPLTVADKYYPGKHATIDNTF